MLSLFEDEPDQVPFLGKIGAIFGIW